MRALDELLVRGPPGGHRAPAGPGHRPRARPDRCRDQGRRGRPGRPSPDGPAAVSARGPPRQCGLPQLDALAEDPPRIFDKPAWTAEEREARRAAWADLGWRRLTCDERDHYRDGFNEAFGFSPQAGQEGPCFREPSPSAAWDLSGLLQAAGERRASLGAELTLKVLAAFRKAAPPGEELLALDALRFYEHYAFDPHRLSGAGREQWAHPVVPDDNFCVFLAKDFRFGLVGDPVRQTLCVFGRRLLDAFLTDLPGCPGRVVRQDGSDVDQPWLVPGQRGPG